MSNHSILKRWLAVGSIGLALWIASQPTATLGQASSPLATPPTSPISSPVPTTAPTLVPTTAPTSAPTAATTSTSTPAPTNTAVPVPTTAPTTAAIPPTNIPPAPAAGTSIDSSTLLLIVSGAAIVLILILMVLGRLRRRPPVQPPTPLVPPTPTAASLEFAVADGQAITINLDKPVMVLGRDSSCDIVLPASLANVDSVSHQHARFNRDQEGIMVHDLESKNGLRVNGRYTNHNLLEDGDRLAFGSVEATFHNRR